jgi:cohesin complex subunit SCC1
MDKRNMGDDFNIGIDDFGREGFQDDLIADIPQVENMETGEGHQREQPLEGEPMEVDKSFVPLANETQREDDGFILEPLNTPDVKSHHKRKRKLVIDTKKELASNFIRSQLQDPSDTLRPKIFPPPNKKALMWKEASYSADQMFKIPLIQNCAQPLTDLIIRNFYYPTESSGASSGVAVVEEPPQEVPENLPENELIVHPVDDGVSDIGNMGGQLMDILDEIGDEPENVQPVDVGMNEEEPSKIIPELLGVNGADNEVQREEESGIGDSDVVEDKGEKRWNKRTQQVMKILDKCFAERDEVNFNDITKKCTRKQAASRFYSCLLLAKEGAVKFKQEAPYTDIIIKHT